MTSRTNNKKRGAFTIVEVIVVVVIIGVLAAIVAPRLVGRVGQAKQSAAKSGASSLATQMKLFITDCGMPPEGSDITVLWQRPSDVDEGAWQGPYVDSEDDLLDPWNNFFELVVPGEKNVDFDIVSYGADGAPGGEDENADIVAP